MTDNDLAARFHQAMIATYQESLKIGYRPNRFFQMVNEGGGVETAHSILAQETTTEGFSTLWEKGRLDLTVEAQVLKPEFAALFSEDERARARARLDDVGYRPPWNQPAPAAAAAPSMLERLARAVSNTQGKNATPAAWIFQANRDNYDLPGALAELETIDWGVRQHADQITVGDTVYMWESGPEAGVLAVATVLSEPALMPEDQRELRFYRDPDRFNGAERRVRLQIERVLAQRLLRRKIQQEPALRNMAILRNAQGTNFALAADEAAALAALVEAAADDSQVMVGEVPGDDEGVDRLGIWQASIDTIAPFNRDFAQRFPVWLAETFGNRATFMPSTGQRFSVLIDGARILWGRVNKRLGVVLRIADLQKGITLEQLQAFSPPLDFSPDRYGISCALYNDTDYMALQQAMQRLFSDSAEASVTQQPMTIADAAFRILSRAGGGPLHLSDILARIQAESMAELRGQTPQLSLASIMLRDERFHNLGKNTWVLASGEDLIAIDEAEPEDETPEPPTREPAIYAEEGARFWRVHFPRELWEQARRAGVIALSLPPDSSNQSAKRFRQIQAGDRVVAYVQGGMIGGVGVVVRPFDPEHARAGLSDASFGEEFNLVITVAWADAPAAPVELLDALRHKRYTDLYNRIKNPHTVIPLGREDYTALLSLLQVDDAGVPRGESRLPNVWAQLSPYISLAHAIGPRSLDSAMLQDVARSIDPPPAEPLDADDLVAELLQLRLIEAADTTRYRARPYVIGDETALLRLCALAVLVPLEGAADQFMLPARTILPRLRQASDAQDAERFAPELGEADSVTLAGWYAEAGLIDVDGDTWQPLAAACDPLPGDDSATETYNLFLHTLIADIAGELASDLAHVDADAPLPEVDNLAARLRELGQELLFDSAVVRRVYRSLLARRHVVLSGPPGTGKTELARLLPALLWREAPQTFSRLTVSPDRPPVDQISEQRHGYASVIVTATEDWGVRDVVGGIGPRLDGQSGALSYTIEYGALTRALLLHYDGTASGKRLPPAGAPVRKDYHLVLAPISGMMPLCVMRLQKNQ